MKRVILDMDPGIDDALGIILAMLSPELKVEAITTVSGNVNVDLCTRNALRVLEILRPEEAPIVARGEAKPLAKAAPVLSMSPIDSITGMDVHGRDGLGELDRLKGGDGITRRYPEPSLYKIASDHAVDVILSLADAHPQEITLIPTGPLTNIARAIIQNPEGIRKIKELIIMGGAFGVPGNATAVAEANILADPYAAEVVLNSKLPVTFVGLDVTRQVLLQRSQVEREIKPLNTRLSEFICDITPFYMDFYEARYGFAGCCMHDPLAVGIAIEPNLVETEEFYIQVETQGKITMGMTVADRRPVKERRYHPNALVCTEVDTRKFLTLFLEAVKGWQDFK